LIGALFQQIIDLGILVVEAFLKVPAVAVASFWLALVLQLFFAMDLGWLPLQARITGSRRRRSQALHRRYACEGNFHAVCNVVAHLALPAFTLAFPALATVVRFTRPACW